MAKEVLRDKWTVLSNHSPTHRLNLNARVKTENRRKRGMNEEREEYKRKRGMKE